MQLLRRRRDAPRQGSVLAPRKATKPLGLNALVLDHRLIVRGESHYMPALSRLLGTSDTWQAWLVREPRNAFDPNAIQVVIDNTCVGYVASEQAEAIAPQLDSLSARGYIVGFRVQLFGGTMDKPNIGVFPED
jgi:hypothetical protein